MNAATYARKNLFRRRGRTILTILGVAVAVLIFCAIRTVVFAWNVGAEEASKDRLGTRHKASITMQLPKRYIEELRDKSKFPGIKAATWASWFGAKDPRERVPFFAGFAADHDTWFDVMDEMKVEPAQLTEWKRTPNGAILGDLLAKSLEVQVGSDLTITSDIYPGDWKFKVVGIYTPLRKTVDRNTMVFHWDYLNKDPRGAFSREQIGWVMSRIDDPTKSAEISRAIDKLFEERDDQTITMSERALQLSFLGGISTVLSVFDWVSLAILIVMALILANTIAMSVRERTHEYGVLRAIGFSPRYLVGFIVGEAVLIAVVGGAAGVLLTMLLVNGAVGPFIEDHMGAIFPYFRTPVGILAAALGLAAVGGVLAGLVPATRASGRKVTDALRRVD
ncbi:MAG TPA: ABC transporter permease [Kofleriaceae bacterium]|nr:ABC transporter permease [Kofleriaceae bacterium]